MLGFIRASKVTWIVAKCYCTLDFSNKQLLNEFQTNEEANREAAAQTEIDCGCFKHVAWGQSGRQHRYPARPTR